jgi:hypothetical protein
MRIMSCFLGGVFVFFFADPIGKTVKEEFVLVEDGLPIAKAFHMTDMIPHAWAQINTDVALIDI